MNQILNFKENIKVQYMYLCTDIVWRPGTSSGGDDYDVPLLSFLAIFLRKHENL